MPHGHSTLNQQTNTTSGHPLGAGTGVALVTPFDAGGAVDHVALARLVSHVTAGGKGVDYLVVLGTTGETATLSAAEQAAVLETVLATNAQALPIVLGVGGNNTAAVCEAAAAVPAGVAAILCVTPYYNKPTQQGLIAHFTAVADASPVPVILYNVPGRTSCNMTAATTLTLAQHDNIIGIKEASGDLEQCMRIAASMPASFQLISGDDLLTVPMTTCGATGVISVLANVIPVQFSAMVSAALHGDYATAQRHLFAITELNGLMYQEGNPAGIKAALELVGVCGAGLRLPLVQASAELRQAINTELDKVLAGSLAVV